MGIKIEDYTEPVKPNEFDDDVKALIESGPGKIGKVVVKAGGKVQATKLAFQRAAISAGHSARVRVEEQDEKGNTTIGFVLYPKRAKRDSDSVEGEASDVTTKD